MPAWAKTRIIASGRNRPDELGDGAVEPASAAQEEEFWANIAERFTVIEPAEVAACVFEGIEQEKFWIYTHGSEFDEFLKGRMESMIEGKNPEVIQGLDWSRPGAED